MSVLDKIDFLKPILEWASKPEVSIIMKATVQALMILSLLVPGPAGMIMRLVLQFFDKFDAQEKASGQPVPVEEKRAATVIIRDQALAEFHGSGNVISESRILYMIALFVDVLGSMRYGENTWMYETAEKKGYMILDSEDLRNAMKTDAGLKLFGI